MKLSQAIETEYRGNLMFHTQDWTPGREPGHPVENWSICTERDVELSFGTTFDTELSPSACGELRPAEVDSEDPLGS